MKDYNSGKIFEHSKNKTIKDIMTKSCSFMSGYLDSLILSDEKDDHDFTILIYKQYMKKVDIEDCLLTLEHAILADNEAVSNAIYLLSKKDLESNENKLAVFDTVNFLLQKGKKISEIKYLFNIL